MTQILTWMTALAAGLALAACDSVQQSKDDGPTTSEASMETEDPTDTTDERASNTTPSPDAPGNGGTASTTLAELNAVNCEIYANDNLTVAEFLRAGPAGPSFSLEAVNANPVSLSDFPGIVKLEPKTDLSATSTSSGHCGATRIAERWFVTAAHCLDSDFDRIVLVVGDEELNSPEARRVTAERAICHAAYGGADQRYSNDLALIEVGPAIAATLFDVPIAALGTDKSLNLRNYPTAFIGGWGITDYINKNLSNELLSAEIEMTSTGPALILADSIDGSGPCIGDSGGPLFVEEDDGARKLVGVLSAVESKPGGEVCTDLYGARFTNLAGFDDWIDDVIATCEADSSVCDL